MDSPETNREELVERLFQKMLADGVHDILGANLPSYEIPDWVNYPKVDIVGRNRYKKGRIAFAVVLTEKELVPRPGRIPEEKLEPVASEWIRTLAETPLIYPHDQIGQFPEVIVGIERQNDETLLSLLFDLGLTPKIGSLVFVEIL